MVHDGTGGRFVRAVFRKVTELTALNIYVVVVPLALVAGLVGLAMRSVQKSAKWMATTVSPTREHPNPWDEQTLRTALFWSPRRPFSMTRWIWNTLVLVAWILIERLLWAHKLWDVGALTVSVLWAVHSFTSFRYARWEPIEGVVQGAQSYRSGPFWGSQHNKESRLAIWWYLTLETPRGVRRVVTSTMALGRERLIDRLSSPPAQGKVVRGWWDPRCSPIVWSWSSKPVERIGWWQSAVIYGMPLFILVAHPNVPKGILWGVVGAIGLALGVHVIGNRRVQWR